MTHSAVYKGTNIAVTTSRNSELLWTAAAEFQPSGRDKIRVEAAEPTYSSEEEAHRAAMRAAAEAIDRGSVSKGKF